MCMIIVKPTGKELSRDICEQSFIHNPHGAGFMFVDDGILKIHKGYFKLSSLWKAYARLDLTDKDVVMHFRLATAGKHDARNCHPFYVNKDIGFAHNGILTEFSYAADVSDTFIFNQTILKKLPPNFLECESIRTLLHIFCKQNYEKFVFMDIASNVHIFGEDLGDWIDGLWFSSTLNNRIYVSRGFGGLYDSYDDMYTSGYESKINVKEDEISVVSNDEHRCNWCGDSTVCYSPYQHIYICIACLNVLLNDPIMCTICHMTQTLSKQVNAGKTEFVCEFCGSEININDIIWNDYMTQKIEGDK